MPACTSNTVFQEGAIRFSYDLAPTQSLSNVRLEALSNGTVVSTLGNWNSTNLFNVLINLTDFSSLIGGDYQFRAVAHTMSGEDFFSDAQSFKILSWNQATNTTYGTFAADTFNYSAKLGTGSVYVRRGGTPNYKPITKM